MRKKAGKCKYIVYNDCCGLSKNWARTFDDKGDPLEEYDYLMCSPTHCPLVKKKKCPKEKCRHWHTNNKEAKSLKCSWWISCVRTDLKDTQAKSDYYEKRSGK